jgi:hypothetical protein
MANIAIIDDNPDQSGTVKNNLILCLDELNSDLNVLALFPFQNLDEYFKFIDENDVCVLILDEKLNDQTFDEIGPVNYKGSQLVRVLRERLKDLPIFSISVISTDKDLLQQYNQFEEIISRRDFYNDPMKYVPKIMRAAKNFLLGKNEAFEEYGDLSVKISNGEAQNEEVKRFQELQLKLDLPLTGFNDRDMWLAKYEDYIERLEILKNEIQNRLGK